MRAIIGAAGGLSDFPDGGDAAVARLIRTIVNSEAFFKTLGAGGGAIIKKAVTSVYSGKIQRHGAAARDGLDEHFTDARGQGGALGMGEAASGFAWRNTRTPKSFTGIYVTNASERFLVEQFWFNGLGTAAQGGVEFCSVEGITQWLGTKGVQRRKVKCESPEIASVFKHKRTATETEGYGGVFWQGRVGGLDVHAPGHAEMAEQGERIAAGWLELKEEILGAARHRDEFRADQFAAK